MNTLFYHIKKDQKHYLNDTFDEGTFTYYEFNADIGITGYLKGYKAFTDSAYKTFNSHAEALSYARKRGGVDVYSY